MTSITIPSTVSVIKQNAFANCTSLQTVEFMSASKLSTIEAYAFWNTEVFEIFLPDSVTFFDSQAFENTTSIYLSDNSEFPNIDFYTNSSRKVFIPKSIVNIPDYKFRNSKNISHVEFSYIHFQDQELKMFQFQDPSKSFHH